jgi:hypothetical protein
MVIPYGHRPVPGYPPEVTLSLPGLRAFVAVGRTGSFSAAAGGSTYGSRR